MALKYDRTFGEYTVDDNKPQGTTPTLDDDKKTTPNSGQATNANTTPNFQDGYTFTAEQLEQQDKQLNGSDGNDGSNGNNMLPLEKVDAADFGSHVEPVYESLKKDLDDKASQLDANLKDQKFYLGDWSNGQTIDEVAQTNKDLAIIDLIRDREKWARDTGGAPLDIFDFAKLARHDDIHKSVADNEKAEKKRRNQERWEQIGNLFSHLGSFVGAMAGGPAQTIESAVELTKRQQALRDKTMAQRDTYSNKLLDYYYRQQAEQRAAKAAENNAEYREGLLKARQRQLDIQEFRAWTDREFKDASLDIKYRLLDIQRDLADGRISLMEAQEKAAKMRAEVAKQKANNGGSGNGNTGTPKIKVTY